MEAITTSTLTANLKQALKIGLTERSTECSVWAAEGKTDEEIGAIIGVKGRTAKHHILRAMECTDTHTRAQLVGQLFIRGVLSGKDAIRMTLLAIILGVTWSATPAAEAATVFGDKDSQSDETARRNPRRGRRSARQDGREYANGLDTTLARLRLDVPDAGDLYSDADLAVIATTMGQEIHTSGLTLGAGRTPSRLAPLFNSITPYIKGAALLSAVSACGIVW